MSSPAFLPNTQPKNNSQSQVRRRVNDSVAAIADQTSELGTLTATVGTKAPAASPAFSGAVTQPALPVLNNAQIHTTANAGGASALPATPAGYTNITINGQQFRIALYKV
jgi:hypothetical protein